MNKTFPNRLTRPSGQLLAFVLAVIILLLSLYFSVKGSAQPKKAESSPVFPLLVRVVNQFDQGFTVVWVTKDKVKGYVVYGDNKIEVEKNTTNSPKTGDIRGDGDFYTHYIDIRGLTTGVDYYFKIISADQTFLLSLNGDWLEAGIADRIRTPNNPGNTPGAFSLEGGAFGSCLEFPNTELVSCFRPNIIYGRIDYQNNQPANDSILLVEIPGKSNTIAAYTNTQGRWVINLANFWKNDLSDKLAYQPGVDLVKLTAYSNEARLISYQPINKVLDTDTANLPINLRLSPFGFTSPVYISPSLTPTNTPSPTPHQPTNTPTNTPNPTNQSASPTPVLIIKLNFKTKNVARLSVRAELKDLAGKWAAYRTTFINDGNNYYRGSFGIAKTGEYYLTLKTPGYLKNDYDKYSINQANNVIDLPSKRWVAGDVNDDEKINTQDVAQLLSLYQANTTSNETSDLNGDGIINILDLAMLLESFNKGQF